MSGMVADWLGRRRAFQISTLPMILGTALSAVAPVLAVMLIGRLLVGIGLGIGGPVLSLYISEVLYFSELDLLLCSLLVVMGLSSSDFSRQLQISPTEIRGMYGSLSQIATCCGILGSLLVGLPISTVPGWWRACFWIATVPAALLLLGMEFCAESPRWLFKKSRWYEAEHELERLWGLSYAKTGMVHLLQNEESEDENTTSSWEDLFDKRYIRVVMIGSALFALQQLSGINAIFYFSATVFRKAGVSSDVAASVCVGVINLLGSCIAAYLMDRKGRRSLLIWSFSGMAFAMAMQAAVGSLHAASSLQGSISLLATSLYVFMFAIGAGPVPALLLPEIFPNAIRAKAMSVAMCVHWVGNVLIGLTYLDLLHHLGAATLYSFFTAVCLLAALFVKKHVLETKGRSLEDIEAFLLGGL
ncbi:hypothetical protein O6H91_18G076200 [Diphasiastrum complanatum]|nr:hypothetical protein O6H91_18G076200 [Diphasiastrum complanatum]